VTGVDGSVREYRRRRDPDRVRARVAPPTAADRAARLDAVIPVALSASTVMAVFLMAVIVLGYVVIWALWHFVFRGAGEDANAERPATAPGPDGPRGARQFTEDDRQG
jgi:hypothetical protein